MEDDQEIVRDKIIVRDHLTGAVHVSFPQDSKSNPNSDRVEKQDKKG